MGRVLENDREDDRYLSPWDGRLAKLVVQATDEVYTGARTSTYRRTFIRNVNPWFLQIANWPFSSVDLGAMATWSGEQWAWVVVKWIPTCAAALVLVAFHFLARLCCCGRAKQRNNDWYDPFLYRFWGYPKHARNAFEDPAGLKPHDERLLYPRLLCFVKDPSNKQLCGAELLEVDASTATTPYVFVAYTSEQFDTDVEKDRRELCWMAESAARDAGVPAYWVACCCMPDDTLEEEVNRINDVIRGAHSLAIAVGLAHRRPEIRTTYDMLKLWGTRMWTLPEALLSPIGTDIKVYTRGSPASPLSLCKKDFARAVWEDDRISRQLVDHYDNTLGLSRLELVNIAIKCLSTRQVEMYSPGDLSYALMGLLRQRPQVDRTDSAFQAFARMSLANDSDMLLERLICLLPKHQNAPLLAMEAEDDAFNCSLWDIYPGCQVAGVGDDDTVILDGAFGAPIRWKSYARVATRRMRTIKRRLARAVINFTPLLLTIAAILLWLKLTTPGIMLLLVALLNILSYPYLIRVTYGGKFWGVQPWFFGFEGYLDIATIESNIFGAHFNRLKWSSAGSPISRHMKDEHGNCVGVDPTTDPKVRAKVKDMGKKQYGDMKIYTLVDTFTLTVTMFEAVRPPVAMLICGHEGGMQRALMCSYDWRSQTLYKETVLRMETLVLEKMHRASRFRFGLSRPGLVVTRST